LSEEKRGKLAATGKHVATSSPPSPALSPCVVPNGRNPGMKDNISVYSSSVLYF